MRLITGLRLISMTSDLVKALFKELAMITEENERLHLRLEKQAQTIRDQTEIIQEFINAKDTH